MLNLLEIIKNMKGCHAPYIFFMSDAFGKPLNPLFNSNCGKLRL